jgi:hypothetical protein
MTPMRFGAWHPRFRYQTHQACHAVRRVPATEPFARCQTVPSPGSEPVGLLDLVEREGVVRQAERPALRDVVVGDTGISLTKIAV